MKRIQISVLATIIATIITASTASAVQLDSTNFNHQYNGDVHPVPGYTETTNWLTTPSSDGNILTYQGTILEGGFWQSDQWLGGPDPVANGTGWTIEFRIRIRNDADDEATGGAFNVFAKDANGTSSSGRRAMVTVGKNWTKAYSFNTATLYSTVENTNGFHVFRYGQLPGSSSMMLWRDGVLLYSGLSKGNNDSSSLLAQMWWGDGSGGTGGPTIDVDYFRWDSTGFYDPVVEFPAVVQIPQNTTNAVGASVTLTAIFTNAITSVQWYKDTNPIGGATTFSSVSAGQISTYNIPSLQPTNEGSYYCEASNTAGLTNTATAYLDVLADVTAPTVVSNIASAWASRVRVRYSEVMDPVTTGEATNYVFQSGALSVASVTVLDAFRADVFTTSRPLPGSNYVLRVSNVQDTSGNPIAPNTPVAFTIGTNIPAITNLIMAFDEASAVTNAFGGHEWLDHSGNENHALNSSTTVNARPLLRSNGLNGHSVYQFTPTPGQTLSVAGTTATGLTENNYTWFAVARCTNMGSGTSGSATPKAPHLFHSSSSYLPSEWQCYFYVGGIETTNAQGQTELGVVFSGRTDPDGNEVAAIPHPIQSGGWNLLSGNVNNANGSFGHVTDPAANTVVTATNNTGGLGLGLGIPAGIRFGARFDGAYRLGGDVAEVLIYTGQITPEEYASVENYLRVKYFPPLLSGQQNGSNFEIHFTGVLQSSTNVAGPFSDVPGNPPNPYVITPGSQLPQQYFRSRNP